MIDGRGQVLIMEFGLAALVDQVEDAEVRNGTPACRAPEQLAGWDVTELRDISSLGLVYEMFTGKRAYEASGRSARPSASSVVYDVVPTVERLIAKCLDPTLPSARIRRSRLPARCPAVIRSPKH